LQVILLHVHGYIMKNNNKKKASNHGDLCPKMSELRG
jgi:hypothetical protein